MSRIPAENIEMARLVIAAAEKLRGHVPTADTDQSDAAVSEATKLVAALGEIHSDILTKSWSTPSIEQRMAVVLALAEAAQDRVFVYCDHAVKVLGAFGMEAPAPIPIMVDLTVGWASCPDCAADATAYAKAMYEEDDECECCGDVITEYYPLVVQHGYVTFALNSCAACLTAAGGEP